MVSAPGEFGYLRVFKFNDMNYRITIVEAQLVDLAYSLPLNSSIECIVAVQ